MRATFLDLGLPPSLPGAISRDKRTSTASRKVERRCYRLVQDAHRLLVARLKRRGKQAPDKGEEAAHRAVGIAIDEGPGHLVAVERGPPSDFAFVQLQLDGGPDFEVEHGGLLWLGAVDLQRFFIHGVPRIRPPLDTFRGDGLITAARHSRMLRALPIYEAPQSPGTPRVATAWRAPPSFASKPRTSGMSEGASRQKGRRSLPGAVENDDGGPSTVCR